MTRQINLGTRGGFLVPQAPKEHPETTRNRLVAILNGAILMAALGQPGSSAIAQQTAARSEADEARMRAVVAFADHALEKGRDRWSGKETPLFADGLEVRTGQPVEWLHKGRRYVLSNLASQQNFFRTLVGLSNLTGDERYRQAAKDATAYMFEHFRSPCGLLYWGGHTFVDLRTLKVVHIEGPHMEIKMHLPYYDLMWHVGREATAKFIRAYWNGNVRDWRRLEINRHAPYGEAMGSLWDSPWDNPAPLYETQWHGSVMPITDMTYSAAWLSQHGDARALGWARRLTDLMAGARHPQTGLGAGRFTALEKRRTDPGNSTAHGDRTRNQFGPEFGEAALDAWNLLSATGVRRIYVEYALSQMAATELLKLQGRALLAEAVGGLKAYARHGYDAQHNVFRAMLGDGSDLTGYTIKRSGWFGDAGETIRPIAADAAFLLSYARAWRLSGDAVLWTTSQAMARGNGLGDIGDTPGQAMALNLKTGCSNPLALLAVLELHRGSGEAGYLSLARRIGDNMIEHRFRNNLFVESDRHIYARFDALDPLALLTLEAAIRGKPDQVPTFIGGLWRYLQGPYDGHGRASDQRLFYSPAAQFQRGPQ